MGQLGLSPSQMEHYVLPCGSECFVHVPNQSALTEVFQDAPKIGFNLPLWAVTGTVGVYQFRKADGVGLHQFRVSHGVGVHQRSAHGVGVHQRSDQRLHQSKASLSALESLLMYSLKPSPNESWYISTSRGPSRRGAGLRGS